MSEIIATWEIQLNCTCPNCGTYLDLLELPDFWDGKTFEVAEWDTKRTRGVKVYCEQCGHEFKVDFEY